MTAYLLCASPRSGSTLLCDLLWQTRVAGKPNSFFRALSITTWCDTWGLPHCAITDFDQAYLDAAVTEGTHGTGQFGMRIMWDNVTDAVVQLRKLNGGSSDPETLANAFGPCKFIHLSRNDKIAEAVSLSIAEQTGLWHRNADGTDRENFDLSDAPRYDTVQIAQELEGLEAEDIGWNRWFQHNNITPHRVTYEALAADPITALADILAFIGHDPAIADGLTPGTQKLATQMNRDWAARFRAEHGLPSAPTDA